MANTDDRDMGILAANLRTQAKAAGISDAEISDAEIQQLAGLMTKPASELIGAEIFQLQVFATRVANTQLEKAVKEILGR